MPKKISSKKKSKQHIVQKTITPQSLMAAAYIAIGFHFLFLFVFPKISTSLTFHRTWGFHFISYFPAPIIVLFYCTLLLLSHPNTAKQIYDIWKDAIFPVLIKIGKIGKYPVYILISLLSFFLFYALRQKYGLLGDNFLRVQDIAAGTVPPNELGTLNFYLLIYRNISPIFGLSAKETLVFVNCMTGPIYVFFSFCIAETLGKNGLQKGLYWTSLMLAAIIQYFFGYIEIYSIVTILLVPFLWTGVLAARNRLPIIIPAVLAIAAFFAHFMAATFLPAIFYLIYRKVLCRWKIFSNPKFIFAEVIVSLPFLILIYIKIVRANVLILTPNNLYSYAMLSWTHVWEFINGQILAAPSAFLMLILLVWFYIKRRKSVDLAGQFLAAAAFFTTLNSFIYNVQKGATDWDVLCMSGLPITLIALYLLFDSRDEPFIRVNLKYISVLFILFTALNTIPWVVLNATDLSISRMVDMIETDPAEFYQNNTHPPAMYLAITFNTNELDEEAENWYRKAVERHPQDPRNYFNLASFLCSHEKLEEAGEIFTTLLQKFPGYPLQYKIAFQVFKNLGKIEEAYQTLEQFMKILEMKPQLVSRYYNKQQIASFKAELALYYKNTQRWQESLSYLKNLSADNPEIVIDQKPIGELIEEVTSRLK